MIAQLERFNKFSSFENELPPSNIEAEEAILGGILLDPNAISRIADLVSPEHFYLHSHALIYDACLTLHKQGKIPDLMTVASYLANNEHLDGVGGQLKLVQLVDHTVSAVNIDQYVELIAEKAVRRKLIENGYRQIASAYEQQTPLGTILSELETSVSSFTRSYARSNFVRESRLRFQQICQELEKIEDELDENEALKQWELRELAKKYGFGNGTSGVRDLLNFHASWINSQHKNRSMSVDEYVQQFGHSPEKWLLAGWIPAESITLEHAKGGEGKTRLTGSMCKALLTGQSWGDYFVPKPCQILFIETDQSERITATQLIEQGFMDENPEVRSRFRPLSNWGIEQYGVLRAEIKEMQERHPDNPVVVVIDSLTSVSNNSKYSENDQEYARPLIRLRKIARDFGATFIVLHHSNAEGKSRGTTAIHNSVDQVWRLERITNNNPQTTEANLIIQKTRSREPGTYRLEYNPDTWHWNIKGVVVDIDGDPQVENYSARERIIIQFFREHPNAPYERQELAHILGISDNTLGKDLGRLRCRGLVSGIRKPGARNYWYFVGELPQLSNNSATILHADPADPLTDPENPPADPPADPKFGSGAIPFPVSNTPPLSSADPTDPPKNLILLDAARKKIADQQDQQNFALSNVEPEVNTTDPKNSDQQDQHKEMLQDYENCDECNYEPYEKWIPGQTKLMVLKDPVYRGCTGIFQDLKFTPAGEIFILLEIRTTSCSADAKGWLKLSEVQEVQNEKI